MPGSRKLLLIENPGASRASPGLRRRLVSRLGEGFDVEHRTTGSAEEAQAESARAARDGFAVVAALGGDGTSRVVAEGLVGSETALLCLPAGSRNVFARMTTGESSCSMLVERLLEDELTPGRVDVGTLDGHIFLFAASVGVSARASEAVNRRPTLKSHLGVPYGILVGIFTGASYLVRPPRIKLTIGSESSQAVSLICQNARPLTYVAGSTPLELCEQVSLDSGSISIGALRHLAVRDLFTIPAGLARRASALAGHPRIEEIAGVTGATIEAIGSRSLPVDLDGDDLGRHRRLEVGVRAAALKVMTAAEAAPGEQPSG